MGNLKEIMKEKNITIDELVKMTNLSNKTINRVRNSKLVMECRLSTLKTIAEALKVRISDLYDDPMEKELAPRWGFKRFTRRINRTTKVVTRKLSNNRQHKTITTTTEKRVYA